MTPAVSARRFASRGGEKLDRALDELSIDVSGLRVLDAGGSTGGWTDCVLKRGAAQVIYVDVAYGALDWGVRTNEKVVIFERTNLRTVTPETIGGRVDIAVADLSFISLRTVLPVLTALSDTLVLLVKPQFESPRDNVPPGGVIREPSVWRAAVEAVVEEYSTADFGLRGAAPSRIPGAKGNREFFVHLERGWTPTDATAIAAAIEGAP